MSPAARRHWTHWGNWVHAATIAALCSGFLFAYGGVPKINDEQLYLPLARAVADPGLYPAGDLVVSSGLRGPFFLYRMAGALYRAGVSVDHWWLAGYAASLFALFVALWWLAQTVSGSTRLAALVTAMFAAASAYRGTVHWFLLPPPNLVISTLAAPPLIAAFALAMRGKRGPALALASIVFNLHPSMGLITAAVIGAVMLLDARTTGRQYVLKWFAVALACALPTAAFVATSTPGNFTAPDPAAFRTVLRTYSWHVFPSDHWREGYGFFVLELGALALLARRTGPQRDAVAFVFLMVAMMVASLVNLATVDIIAVDLLFLFRAAGSVKMLVWIGIAAALATNWRGATIPAKRWFAATAALFMLAALSKNADIGEGFAALGCATALVAMAAGPRPLRLAFAPVLALTGIVEILGQGWGFLHIAPFSPQTVTTLKLGVLAVACVWLAGTLAWRFSGGSSATDTTVTAIPSTNSLVATLLTATAVFALTIGLRGHLSGLRPATLRDVAKRARLAEPDPTTRAVIAWAGTTPRGSLFAVPPDEGRFSALRLAAGRGLYIQTTEVIQVAYDVAAAAEAHRRVLALGTRISGPHEFNDAAYGTLSADSVLAIARDGADFAIFPRAARATRPLPFPAVYSDSLWTVLDLRRSR